jgi:FAD synthase
MQTIHFPDDARPSWLVHPVLALGNFDGLHRGHQTRIRLGSSGRTKHHHC